MGVPVQHVCWSSEGNNILQGVPDPHDPCIRTTLCEVAMCTDDLVEDPQLLQDERLSSDLLRGRGKSIGGDLDVNEEGSE
jgi:hypothetical protein